MRKIVTVSLVISVYNEEQALPFFISHFLEIEKDIKENVTLYFVNDGSTDRSLEILREFQENSDGRKVKIINLLKNYGHEAAMIAGIDAAEGDAVICMDADLQHPLELIPEIDAMLGKKDIVLMKRTENRSAGVFEKSMSYLFYKLINFLSEKGTIVPGVSDFFGMTKQVADMLRQNYRSKNRFLRGYVQTMGFDTAVIKYNAAERVGGKSHYNMSKLVRLSLMAITCLSTKPLMFPFNLVLFFTLLLIPVFIAGIVKGSSILLLLSADIFMFVIMMVMLGIIGKYIAVLYDEINNEPIYLKKEDV